MVLKRWAMTKLVRPRIRRSKAPWMRASVRVSTLLVASSRMRMRGSARMARAMVSSWRWPWLRLLPRSDKRGLVAVRELADKMVGVGQAGGLDALLIGGFQAPIADVLQDRTRE